MAMTAQDVMDLAARCAPAVAPGTLAAIVQVESGFDPLVIGLNGRPPRRLHPATRAEAAATASRLLAQGANIDLGLGQINVRNLAPLGLTVADAFDPCRNLEASARVIATDYAQARPSLGAEQAALRTSLSLYNTGTPWRGVANGYVSKVTAAAGQIVPALQSDAPRTAVSMKAAPPDRGQGQAAPAWDVFAQAKARPRADLWSAPGAPAAGFVFTPAASGDGR